MPRLCRVFTGITALEKQLWGMEEINFNSDSDHPGSHALEDKTRSGTTTIPIDAKCKSRFGIFAIFVERRQPRGRQNVEKRERERRNVVGGGRYHGTTVAHTLWPPCLVIVSRCKISRSIYAPLPATALKTRRWSTKWRVLFILRG